MFHPSFLFLCGDASGGFASQLQICNSGQVRTHKGQATSVALLSSLTATLAIRQTDVVIIVNVGGQSRPPLQGNSHEHRPCSARCCAQKSHAYSSAMLDRLNADLEKEQAAIGSLLFFQIGALPEDAVNFNSGTENIKLQSVGADAHIRPRVDVGIDPTKLKLSKVRRTERRKFSVSVLSAANLDNQLPKLMRDV